MILAKMILSRHTVSSLKTFQGVPEPNNVQLYLVSSTSADLMNGGIWLWVWLGCGWTL